MPFDLNETHDARRKSWVESANGEGGDFPIQNLPFGIFRAGGAARAGVAIGDSVLDVSALAPALGEPARAAAEACRNATLNALLALGHEAASALRLELSRLLSSEQANLRRRVERHLLPMREVEMLLPVKIGDFTDFYASVYHATNAGRMFRPDNPLLPNYKYLPVAYHSRASSVRVSGTAFRRPKGQVKPADGAPVYQPCRHLDFELELGFYIGTPSQLGEPVPVARAEEHVFGCCLLNDWSARDMQTWEYQPLGPFLAKNFMTTVSPWVVTWEALLPYRVRPFARAEGDPAPLPHLSLQSDQGLAVALEPYLLTARMRQLNLPPFRMSTASTADLYWTVAQMVAHHTSNGCNLETGDLIGTGTVSGAQRNAWGSLLELTARGKEPLELPGGEKRRFLEDGDEVIFRGHCEKPGFARIGFGECRAAVLPAA
jgi:fumarylacetoacetase